ncbi:hypothetical protein IG631_20446 [Alternaria alternata]|jgi:hypothetical protein|nr:hypothetical protein IG631_20446 [Alternaria alternata]
MHLDRLAFICMCRSLAFSRENSGGHRRQRPEDPSDCILRCHIINADHIEAHDYQADDRAALSERDKAVSHSTSGMKP